LQGILLAYRLPPLSTFRTFESAARHLSFTKAAEELHVTPSAVSQQIKTLEDWLGCRLFHRRQNLLQLTEDGLAMCAHVREGLDCFAAAVAATRHDTAQALNVTAPPSFATRWLVPRLSRFSSAHPAVAIRVTSTVDNIDRPNVVPGPKNALIDLRDDEGEVAIRFGGGFYPGYEVEKILTPDFVVVCNPRLLTGESPLRTPADLGQHILIHDESIPSAGKGLIWSAWLKLAGVDGIDSERGPRFSNTLLVIEAVLEGQGVALVPRPLVEADVAAGRLSLPFAFRLPSEYSYYLVVPGALAARGPVAAFRAWLQAEAAALPVA
jgi:LysR family glycine cleavage system transcriptional activator